MLLKAIAVVFVIVLIGCDSDTKPMKRFSNYLEGLGYSFYNPPRTDRGPASVFRFVQGETGKTIISPVCRKLFENIPENTSDLSIPSENSSDQLKAGFVVSLIKDFFVESPKLDAGWNSESNVTVHFKDVSSIYINEEDLFNSKGVARSISPSCFAALGRLAKQGKLSNGVFIIQSSIRVGEMSYELKESTLGNASAGADIKKLINFKPGVSYELDKKNNLIIKEPRFIAFRAFLLKDYIDTGLTSSGSAIVKTEPEPLSPATIKKKLIN